MSRLAELLKEANIKLESRKVEKEDILSKLKDKVKTLGGFKEEGE